MVHQDVVNGVAVLADGHRLEGSVLQYQALVVVGAEDHLLAVAQDDGLVCTDLTRRDCGVRAVVENHAVGEHLAHRSALVQRSGEEYLLIGLHVHIEAAGEEGTAGTDDQLTGREGILHSAVGRSLGDGAELGCRAVLSLGEAVYLVVEQDDVQVDITADGVDEVVATDGEGITVTACLPYAELGSGHLQTGGESRSTAVDAVETEGIHVVRETAGAADTRYHYEFLLGKVERLGHCGQGALECCQNCVVAATGAPANFLITLEILCCIFHDDSSLC